MRGPQPPSLVRDLFSGYGIPSAAGLFVVFLLAEYLTGRHRTRRDQATPPPDDTDLTAYSLLYPDGIGLLGDGANAYCRALLAEILSDESKPIIMVKALDLLQICDGPPDQSFPADRFIVAPNLAYAIEYMEHQLNDHPQAFGEPATMYWFVDPTDAEEIVQPLVADPKVHGIILGNRQRGPTYTLNTHGNITHIHDIVFPQPTETPRRPHTGPTKTPTELTNHLHSSPTRSQ